MKVTLQKIRMNQGGYDAFGSYWGVGRPLYWVSFELDGIEQSDHIRADGRQDAKEKIRQKWSWISHEMTFYN